MGALSIEADELVLHHGDHCFLLLAEGKGLALLLGVAVAQDVVVTEVSGGLVA